MPRIVAPRSLSPLPYFPPEVIDQMRRTNRRTRRTGREHGFYAYHTNRGRLRLGPVEKGGPLSLSMRPKRTRLAFSYHCHVTPGDLLPSVNDIVSAIRDNEPLFYIGAPGGWVREFRPLAGTADYMWVLQHGLLEGETTKASSGLLFTRSTPTGLYVGSKFYRVLNARPARKLPRLMHIGELGEPAS